MNSSETDRHPPFLSTGVLLILLGGTVFSLRESLSPAVIGLCALLFLFCVWRGIPDLLSTAFVAGVLMASWATDGILAVLWPFGVGAVVAFLFAPLVRLLEGPLRSRTAAILVVMVTILVAIVGIGVAFVPRLISELLRLIEQFPAYSARMKVWYSDLLLWATQVGIGERVEALHQQALEDMPGIGQAALEYLGGKLSGFITRAAGLLDMAIVPFVAFYLLKDGDRIGNVAANLLPSRHRGRVLSLLRQIDCLLGDYVRGQMMVCGIVGTLTSVGLALCGIPYFLLLGAMSGLLNVVPYVGLLLSLAVSATVALFEPQPMGALLQVVMVFIVVQGLEANFITPKIVGERVGLHPIWVILAVMVFSRLWGVFGMVAAVPVTAVINVLVRVVAAVYYGSAYYQRESS